MMRTDALLDQLAGEQTDVVAWVGAEWTSEHADAVAAAMEQMVPIPEDGVKGLM